MQYVSLAVLLSAAALQPLAAWQLDMRERNPTTHLVTPIELNKTIIDGLGYPAAPAPDTSPGVVSVARLQHKVPKKAQQAYDRAAKLTKEGKYLEASRVLEDAVRIDPDFALAHNNLGVKYFLLERYAEAEREYRRAAELDPSLADAHTNLAALALVRGDLARVEAEARAALKLAPRDEHARSLLQLSQQQC